jgi:hypothetical protein
MGHARTEPPAVERATAGACPDDAVSGDRPGDRNGSGQIPDGPVV